jgi:hypothetical protein
MEAIAAFTTLIAVIVALDLAAWRWGADTRPSIPDDHAR